MPFISRLFIKTGIIYLILSMILFMLMQIPGTGFSLIWRPVFYHMLMTGWITQIIFGVAIWMFPRKLAEKHRKDQPVNTKGNLAAYNLVYLLLNIGLLLRWIFEPMVDSGFTVTGATSTQISGAITQFYEQPFRSLAVLMIPLSGILQLLAFIIFSREMWPRVRGKRPVSTPKKPS